MAYKALIFGTDDIYKRLKPFYKSYVKRGILNIVAIVADVAGDNINLVYTDGRRGGVKDIADFDIVIISSRKHFYQRMKQLESMGVSRDQIIEGYIFTIPNLDFPRLLTEGIAYGIFTKRKFHVRTKTNYPQVYKFKKKHTTLTLGKKSYISFNCTLRGKGIITVENCSSIAQDVIFALGENNTHNYQNVSTIPRSAINWQFPAKFLPPQGKCKILIGNDVWIGRGCVLKCTNPNKPLVIGDGAVIASNSVVVKSVPPYAIVGGNPAQIIKYRFEPHIIDALLRIKWWDWSLDKIHDNFKYFNDIEKFIALHDN